MRGEERDKEYFHIFIFGRFSEKCDAEVYV